MTDNQPTERTHGRGGYNKPVPLQHASSAQQDPQSHSEYRQVESAHQYVYQEPAAKYPGPREGNALASPYYQGTTPHNDFQQYDPPLRNEFQQYSTPLQNEFQNFGPPSQPRMTKEPNSSVQYDSYPSDPSRSSDSPIIPYDPTYQPSASNGDIYIFESRE